jgi:hypothetical protein
MDSSVYKSCPMNPAIEDVLQTGLYFLEDHMAMRQRR